MAGINRALLCLTKDAVGKELGELVVAHNESKVG